MQNLWSVLSFSCSRAASWEAPNNALGVLARYPSKWGWNQHFCAVGLLESWSQDTWVRGWGERWTKRKNPVGSVCPDHSVSRAVTLTSSGPAEKPQSASHGCPPAMLAGDLSPPVPTLTGGWPPPPHPQSVTLNFWAVLTPRQRKLLVRAVLAQKAQGVLEARLWGGSSSLSFFFPFLFFFFSSSLRPDPGAALEVRVGPRPPRHLIQVAKGQGCHCPAPGRNRSWGLPSIPFSPDLHSLSTQVIHSLFCEVLWGPGTLRMGLGVSVNLSNSEGLSRALGSKVCCSIGPSFSDS